MAISQTIFLCVFIFTEKLWLKNSLTFVPKGPIDNDTALVKIMAWCRIGDKPFSEPMLAQLTDANMRHSCPPTKLLTGSFGWVPRSPQAPVSCQYFPRELVMPPLDWNQIEIVTTTYTSRALMEGINMEKSSQGCYKAMQLSQ